MRRPLTIFTCLIALSQPSQSGEISPSSIKAEIARNGATVVVDRLDAGSGAAWKSVLDHIASGQATWLSVARALRPGVASETGEDLTRAVAKGLPANPSGVLAMAGRDFPIDAICDVPFVEPTDEEVVRWKQSVLIALTRVTSASLSGKLRECHAVISAAW